MYTLTLILPKDRTELEKKYAELLAKAVAEILNPAELELYIKMFKEQEGIE